MCFSFSLDLVLVRVSRGRSLQPRPIALLNKHSVSCTSKIRLKIPEYQLTGEQRSGLLTHFEHKPLFIIQLVTHYHYVFIPRTNTHSSHLQDSLTTLCITCISSLTFGFLNILKYKKEV